MADLAEKSGRVRFVPGQPDMWAFVLFETLVFTAYFGFYLFYRTQSPEAFLHSQAQLDLARVSNERYQYLLKQGFVAQQDADTALATFKTATAARRRRWRRRSASGGT